MSRQIHKGGIPRRPAGSPLRRVLILGAYGTANVGDEAILESILSTLARSGIEMEVTILANDDVATSARHNIPAVFAGWRRDLLRKIRLFQSSDLLICGGGGLVQDTFPNRVIQGPAPRYSLLMLLARSLGCRVVTYGLGIGPLRTRYARWISAQALGVADLVCVRDTASAELVHEITRGRVPACAGADVALLLEPIRPEEALSLAEARGVAEEGGEATSRPVAAVCPRPWFHRGDIWPDGARFSEQYLGRMSCFVSTIIHEIGARVLLIPFDYREDLPVCEDIWTRSGQHKDICVIRTPLDPKRAMGLVSLTDVLIGTRLHSLIFATRVGVPSVAVVYDPKVSQFMDETGQRAFSFSIDTFDPEKGAEAVHEILSEGLKARKNVEAARDCLIGKAERAQDLLMQTLRNLRQT